MSCHHIRSLTWSGCPHIKPAVCEQCWLSVSWLLAQNKRSAFKEASPELLNHAGQGIHRTAQAQAHNPKPCVLILRLTGLQERLGDDPDGNRRLERFLSLRRPDARWNHWSLVFLHLINERLAL